MPKLMRIVSSGQQTPQKQPWERMNGERASWFLLFCRYCQMGRDRSLQALWEQEHPAQTSTESEESENADAAPLSQKLRSVSRVSGSWKKQAAAWKWHERAEEFDAWLIGERETRLLTFLDHDALYITAAQRLDTLDTLMVGLMTAVRDKEFATKDMRCWLAWHKQAVVVLREIRKEMRDFEGLSRK